MATFAVQYRYDDRASVRDTIRPAHRAFLAGLLADGVLVASGPYLEGPPGALLLVRGADARAVESTLDQDPFWVAGLVAGRDLRAWDPVLNAWD